MNTALSLPMSVRADASNRALRTLMQGLIIDVAVAVCLVLAPAFTSIEWTSAYWAALGLSLARTALQSVVSYIARMVVPPVGDATGDDIPEGAMLAVVEPDDGGNADTGRPIGLV